MTVAIAFYVPGKKTFFIQIPEMKGLPTTHIQYSLQGSGFIALNPKP
jgi:hypothetical protein